MQVFFDCAKVKGVAVCVPRHFQDFEDFPQWSQREVERIAHSTGFTKVRKLPEGKTTSDLCFAAAQRLLSKLDLSSSEIDAIVFVSQTPDHLVPATSVVLQHRLQIPTNALAFDINYGCSGYIYALLQAHLLIRSAAAERVLLCVGDTGSRLVSPDDKALRLLLGDAGSATLVERGSERTSFCIHTDGSRASVLMSNPSFLSMDGMAVMNFALQEVPSLLDEILKVHGWQKEEVELFALHQANRLIVESLRRKFRLNPSQVPFLLGEYGNLGPATLPTLLCLARRQSGPWQKMVLCGFGSGLSWGAMATGLSKTLFLDVEEVDFEQNQRFQKAVSL